MKVKRMLDGCAIACLYLWKVLMNYKNHNHIIQENNIKLIPICETDWEYLFKWNKDKEILYFSKGRVYTFNRGNNENKSSVCKKYFSVRY